MEGMVIDDILSILSLIMVVVAGMVMAAYVGYQSGLRKKINTLTDGYITGLEEENQRLKSERAKN
tara:strand:+ start:524 stop:718 length:195 start_codon:yes stop_codon:yes gene_type:complete